MLHGRLKAARTTSDSADVGSNFVDEHLGVSNSTIIVCVVIGIRCILIGNDMQLRLRVICKTVLPEKGINGVCIDTFAGKSSGADYGRNNQDCGTLGFHFVDFLDEIVPEIFINHKRSLIFPCWLEVVFCLVGREWGWRSFGFKF